MAEVIERLNEALAARYTVERELGSGGMATVYLVEDLKLHRELALNVLRPVLAESLDHECFVREIQALASLNQPHILISSDSGGPSHAPVSGWRGAGFNARRSNSGAMEQ